jgi:hypothetical protein
MCSWHFEEGIEVSPSFFAYRISLTSHFVIAKYFVLRWIVAAHNIAHLHIFAGLIGDCSLIARYYRTSSLEHSGCPWSPRSQHYSFTPRLFVLFWHGQPRVSASSCPCQNAQYSPHFANFKTFVKIQTCRRFWPPVKIVPLTVLGTNQKFERNSYSTCTTFGM